MACKIVVPGAICLYPKRTKCAWRPIFCCEVFKRIVRWKTYHLILISPSTINNGTIHGRSMINFRSILYGQNEWIDKSELSSDDYALASAIINNSWNMYGIYIIKIRKKTLVSITAIRAWPTNVLMSIQMLYTCSVSSFVESIGLIKQVILQLLKQ